MMLGPFEALQGQQLVAADMPMLVLSSMTKGRQGLLAALSPLCRGGLRSGRLVPSDGFLTYVFLLGVVCVAIMP